MPICMGDLTGGIPLGQVFDACFGPIRPLYDVTRYYYFPRIMKRHELANHGIDVSFNQEVLVV